MKKLLHKFRVWLIKKLGGNYGLDIRQVEFRTTYTKPISLSAKTTVSEDYLYRYGKEVSERLIKNECARQIADMILHNDNLYEIVRFNNPIDLKCTFVMNVLVVEQPKDKGLKGEIEECKLRF